MSETLSEQIRQALSPVVTEADLEPAVNAVLDALRVEIKAKQQRRTDILAVLKALKDSQNSQNIEQAEDLILALIDDKEIAEAFDDVRYSMFPH